MTYCDIEVVFDAKTLTVSDLIRVLQACEVCGTPWQWQEWDLEGVWIGDVSGSIMERLVQEIEDLGIPGVRVRACIDADDNFEEEGDADVV